jgi:hypothetical protein
VGGIGSRGRRGAWRRGVAIGFAALACAALVGSAAAAPASGGRHLPGISLLNERVAIKGLPFPLRLAFRAFGGGRVLGPGAPKRGPVWFGEVHRPHATIEAAGTKRWICDFELPDDELGDGGGNCTPLAEIRNLSELSTVFSCNGSRRFRVHGLVPDGVTGLEVERAGGKVTRTIPVVDNTFAFSIGHVDVTLRGVGDGAAERLEHQLPLARPNASRGGDCSGYAFTEPKPKN